MILSKKKKFLLLSDSTYWTSFLQLDLKINIIYKILKKYKFV